MKYKIDVKLRQAEEQSTLWRRNLAAAQEQVTRWGAVAQVCRELLAEAGETGEAEEQDSEGAEERAGLGG